MIADFIIQEARIHTLNPEAASADTMVIGEGRILAIGSGLETERWRGDETVIRNLGGAFVMPGFVDVHNHHAIAGHADLYELTFSPSASFDDILSAVAKYCAGREAGSWIVGGSWGSTLIGELSANGARQRLDVAAGGRPVILVDDSHHNRFVSSRALELAGVSGSTVDSVGGVIVRDPHSGEPSGVLLEAAGLLIEAAHRASAPETAFEHERSSARGIQLLHSFGVTAFQDAAISLEAMRALKTLDDRGELDAWVVSSMTVNDQIFGYSVVGDDLIARGEEFRSTHHRPDFIKIFLDGVPPAHTAAFLEPYLPDQEHGAQFFGATTMQKDRLLDWLRKAAKRGISAKIHCTGDAAVRTVLDCVTTLRAEGFRSTRYQIAHGQFIAESDLSRLAVLGVSADISPFLWFPGEIPLAIASVLPEERASRMQPNRSLIDSGALVAGGSDWPVCESPNAWEGIQGLVTRADPSGRHPGQLWPEQAISLEEAIAVFTINGAVAMGLEGETGSLSVGKSADFMVTDRDPFDGPVDAVASTVVTETWFAGREVFHREAMEKI